MLISLVKSSEKVVLNIDYTEIFVNIVIWLCLPVENLRKNQQYHFCV